ncbi:SCO-spondin-like [Xenia sp. Carnegie-2017]|uniref:SCO-spondin-like n=1 Tax=Xenia sp. Carnegie-2017 TaxID=2897299 RepID=UPI001F0455C3|nr:SCO-spondin-like [Xenia sp. Carnegie-2017]
MLYKSCSCKKTCQNTSCDKSSCVPGCQCPDGTFDNGISCVGLDQCHCVVNGKIMKPNETWTEGECLTCKCSNGKPKCQRHCRITSCPNGYELRTPFNECCRCVPVTKTPVTTNAPRPTYPPNPPCNVAQKKVTVPDSNGCVGTFLYTSCVGFCSSNATIDLFSYPYVQTHCLCCQPSSIAIDQTTMKCADRVYQHKYMIIESCRCTACGTNPLKKEEQTISNNLKHFAWKQKFSKFEDFVIHANYEH